MVLPLHESGTPAGPNLTGMPEHPPRLPSHGGGLYEHVL